MIGQADVLLSVQLSQLAAERGVTTAEATPSPEVLLHSVTVFGDLARVAGDLQSQAVAAAQESGLSWAKIGSALGTSRQAAQQRFDSRRSTPVAETEATRILGPVSRAEEIDQINAAGRQGWKLARSLHGEHVLERSEGCWEALRVSVLSPRALPSAAEGWEAASTRFPDCFYVRRLS
ncbi:hypothetical protein D6T64_20535 [Cryobacterium melibiosiphilum]|uniref:Uncharacterized protein n=1 Tax=Cryobacterium melibiosiphilum TaxID=995039 RepID=A0A3A5M8T3_9MICO|nr:hypothetical protein [Cryobacterium melibiosiphilum]RJT84560.1 hypothetical protein D6T64_20535 [Cryobacterium melibiosiphilum]